MSEEISWTVIAIIAAVVLSLGFMAWRNRRRPGPPGAADDPGRVDSFWQKHRMFLSLMALSLAGLAQYALQLNQPVLAAFGYSFAAILFTRALHQFVPAVMGETPAPTARPKAHSPRPLPTTRPIAVSEPAPVTSSNLVSVTNSQTLTAPDTIPTYQVVPSTGPVGGVIPAPAKHGSAPGSAAVTIWSGFTYPDSILLTLHGQILVMDAAQQIIYQLDPNGQIVRQWSVPPLPEPNGHNLALSPDGRHLYITDARKGVVYAITLEG